MDRTFEPREGVNSVQFGADPHVVLDAGQTYTSSDPIEIAALEENPFLTSCKKPAAAAKAPKAPKAGGPA